MPIKKTDVMQLFREIIAVDSDKHKNCKHPAILIRIQVQLGSNSGYKTCLNLLGIFVVCLRFPR